MTDSPILFRLSLADDVAALRRGDLSLFRQIDCLKARFEAVEPALQAYLPETNRFERLRRDAERLNARYPDPASRPPLFGALVGVKDIFHIDGAITRAGTQVPPCCFAGAEGAVVKGLRAAGALIVGKTVTTEFAYFEPGPTRNPHNLAHTPGGSSSGSAAAIAAGLAHITTGTQTVGSIIRPAAYCGIVGFKPSFGRLDTAGLVAFSPSADHVGFFTSAAADMRLLAATLLKGVAGSVASSDRPVLAVPEGAYLQGASALDVFEAQLYVLESAGYQILRINLLDDIATIDSCHQDMIAAELAQQHEGYFAEFCDRYRPRTAALIRYGGTVTADRLRQARQHRLALRERLHTVMAAAGVDLWVCPSAPDVAPASLNATGSPKMNLPWTHAGLPALSLPAGLGMLGLPIGLQLVGRFGADERVLSWAAAMEPLFA